MITSVPKSDIPAILIHQLESFFPICEKEKECINERLEGALSRIEKCFSPNPNKYYHRNGETYFNPFHSGQYTVFLYFYSREIFLSGNSILADKVYYLNKIMNSCDLFYEVELPSYFSLDHPHGTVMGRAKYSDGLSFAQYSTVGNNKGIYPVIGKNCRMCMNSAIIGNCHIGDNVTIGAGCLVKDTDIQSDSLVFGQSPNLIIKKKKE
jgi:serine O-acetyltransferase